MSKQEIQMRLPLVHEFKINRVYSIRFSNNYNSTNEMHNYGRKVLIKRSREIFIHSKFFHLAILYLNNTFLIMRRLNEKKYSKMLNSDLQLNFETN